VTSIDGSIHRLVADMMDSMIAAKGVGIAAPQIGVALRVVVLGVPGREPFALINPEIVRRSGERRVTEGCLSVPGYRGEITRSLSVVVRALDEKGRQTRIKASAKTENEEEALLAQALEHEVDHVNGILYIDHLASLDELVKIEPEEGLPDEEVEEAEGQVEEAENIG